MLIQFNEYLYEKSFTLIQVNSVLCDRNFLLLFPIFCF